MKIDYALSKDQIKDFSLNNKDLDLKADLFPASKNIILFSLLKLILIDLSKQKSNNLLNLSL